MDPSIYRRQIPPPQAWRGADLGGKQAITRVLPDAVLAELDDRLTAVKAAGLGLDDLERRHFEGPAIRAFMAGIDGELRHGRGIVIVAGFPVTRRSEEDIGFLFWGLGCHLGSGLSQSVMGDRLGHVVDVGGKDVKERAYRNSVELSLHTDISDVLAMLCLTQAPKGGESLFASALAVHNELLASAPELLEVLYGGFHYHRVGEQAPGAPPITRARIPLLSCLEDQVSCSYVREYIELAAEESGKPLSAKERAALDRFDAIAGRDDMRLEFRLAAGEAVFLNDLTVMHSRRAFWDGEASASKRHLLRLWLKTPQGRPLHAAVEAFRHEGIPKQEGRSTYYRGRGSQAAPARL